ncbi:hypothetical protein IPH25_03210 [bacterium]|nr:MAG: hypothetical protein IPG37_00200 [bacterium]QQR61475.1 MAG: hypothetical protein IPH25_03210 [bacterium]QQR62999.1 MAG: hypothetical protein IPH67_00800 [bacterium]
MNDLGIIVFKPLNLRKAFILDEHKGMLQIIIQDIAGCKLGGMITYFLKNRYNNYYLEHYKIESLPLSAGKKDIVFLHTVFDIIYAFTPLYNPMPAIFRHLTLLYDEKMILYYDTAIWKKIFLARLLWLLGLYQEENMLALAFLKKIEHIPIDMISIETLDLALNKALDQWINDVLTVYQRMNGKNKIFNIDFL